MIRVTHTELERAAFLCQLAASNTECFCEAPIKHRMAYFSIAMAIGMYDPDEDGPEVRDTVGISVSLAETTVEQILMECGAAAWELEHDLEAQARLEEGRLPPGWELIQPDPATVN